MECTSKNYKFASQQPLAEAQGEDTLSDKIIEALDSLDDDADHLRATGDPAMSRRVRDARNVLHAAIFRNTPLSTPVEARLPPRKNEREADGKFRTVYLFDTPLEQVRFQQQVEAFYQQPASGEGFTAADMMDAADEESPSAPTGDDRWKSLIDQWQRRVEAAGYDGVEDALDAAIVARDAGLGPADGGFTAADMMEARQEGRKEAELRRQLVARDYLAGAAAIDDQQGDMK